MATIDENTLRTARDQTDRTIALVQRVIRQTGDPDGELAKAVEHYEAARDRLRRSGHDGRFDTPTKDTTP